MGAHAPWGNKKETMSLSCSGVQAREPCRHWEFCFGASFWPSQTLSLSLTSSFDDANYISSRHPLTIPVVRTYLFLSSRQQLRTSEEFMHASLCCLHLPLRFLPSNALLSKSFHFVSILLPDHMYLCRRRTGIRAVGDQEPMHVYTSHQSIHTTPSLI